MKKTELEICYFSYAIQCVPFYYYPAIPKQPLTQLRRKYLWKVFTCVLVCQHNRTIAIVSDLTKLGVCVCVSVWYSLTWPNINYSAESSNAAIRMPCQCHLDDAFLSYNRFSQQLHPIFKINPWCKAIQIHVLSNEILLFMPCQSAFFIYTLLTVRRRLLLTWRLRVVVIMIVMIRSSTTRLWCTCCKYVPDNRAALESVRDKNQINNHREYPLFCLLVLYFLQSSSLCFHYLAIHLIGFGAFSQQLQSSFVNTQYTLRPTHDTTLLSFALVFTYALLL